MGGMETYSAKLVEQLKSLADVEPIYLAGNRDGSPPGMFAVVAFGLRATASLVFAREPADIVHIGDMASWPLALAAQLRSRKSTIAISAHGTDVSYPDKGGSLGFIYDVYLRLGARFLKVIVIANSPATARRAERYGFAELVSVPLGTDIEPSGDPKVGRNILFAGRLLPRKGCAWFVENVLPKLPAGIEFNVAGTIWDEGERRALNAPKVHYIGKLDREDLVEAYADALCVVVPNIETAKPAFEGFGLVAVEAAAAGGVVVAAATSGLDAAVIDGTTGFKCPPEDIESWVQTITNIAEWSKEERADFIAASLPAVRSFFNWQRVAQETFAAYGWSNDVQI